MTGFLLSPAAKSDVEEIWDYTAERWGLDQAESYTQGIRDLCDAVASGKRRGRPVDIRDGYLKMAVGAHMAYFKTRDDGTIVIMRILHQSMDAGRHL